MYGETMPSEEELFLNMVILTFNESNKLSSNEKDIEVIAVVDLSEQLFQNMDKLFCHP